MLHYAGVVGYAVLGVLGGARNGGRCWLSGRRVGSIGMLRNLFWKEIRWGVGKSSGTYIRLDSKEIFNGWVMSGKWGQNARGSSLRAT